jgi:hypothetical protein
MVAAASLCERRRRHQVPARSSGFRFALSSFRRDQAVNTTVLLYWWFRTAATVHPANSRGRGALSRRSLRSLRRCPLARRRMNHQVRIWWIVIPLHRMPAGGAGLIADDGGRRAVALIVSGAVPLGEPGAVA